MGDYYVGSFMGGLGRGWDQGKKMADDVRERRMRKEIEQASQERADVDTGMDDEALWRSDNSAQQARMLEEQTGGMGLHRVRGKEYGRLSDATQAADKFNSLEGRYGRLAGVYARHGQAEKAMAFEKAIQDIAHQKQVADEATKRTAIAEKTFARQEGDWAKSDALDAALAQASRGYAGDQASMRVALGDLSRMTPEERAMISAGKADMSVLGQLGGLQRGEGDLSRALAGAYEQFGGAKGVADANRLRKEARAYDKEGLSEALDKARAGDMLGATMLWNGKGEFTGQIPTRVYTDPKTKEEYVEWVDLRTGKAGKASTAELEMSVKERRTDELTQREQARKEKHDADWLTVQREQNAAMLKAAGLRSAGSRAEPGIPDFDAKEFVANAALMGLPVTTDNAGNPVYTAEYKQLMQGTQEVMARTGAPMWVAMTIARNYAAPAPGGAKGAPVPAPTKAAPAAPAKGLSPAKPTRSKQQVIDEMNAVSRQMSPIKAQLDKIPFPVRARGGEAQERLRKLQIQYDTLAAELRAGR